MQRQNLICLSLTLMLLLSSTPARACGDKLLVLGQASFFQIPLSEYRGVVIFFINPATPGSDKWEFIQWQRIMKDAGNDFKTVSRRDDLETELKSRHPVVVLADISDVPEVEGLIKTAPSRAVILPWVNAEGAANKAKLEKTKAAAVERYGNIVERATLRNVMSNVEKAMKKATFRRPDAGTKRT